MTTARTLILPYPPSVNNLYVTVQHGRRALSKEGKAYKLEVAMIARGLGDPFDGPVKVDVDFHRPRRAGDLDNVLKALLDSLTGVLWVDDSQVSEIHARRFEDKLNPRAEITVRKLALSVAERKVGSHA